MALRLDKFVPRSKDAGEPSYHAFLGTTQSAALIPPGRAWITCTQITDYDPTIPYEGLWVFTSQQPHPVLEAWLDSLDALAQGSRNHMVVYTEAVELLGGGAPVTRGGSPPRQTAQQARAMADSLAAAMLRGSNDWPFEELRPWSAVWPVEPLKP